MSEPRMDKEWAKWSMWAKSEPNVSQELVEGEPRMSQGWAKNEPRESQEEWANWTKWAKWVESELSEPIWGTGIFCCSLFAFRC